MALVRTIWGILDQDTGQQWYTSDGSAYNKAASMGLDVDAFGFGDVLTPKVTTPPPAVTPTPPPATVPTPPPATVPTPPNVPSYSSYVNTPTTYVPPVPINYATAMTPGYTPIEALRNIISNVGTAPVMDSALYATDPVAARAKFQKDVLGRQQEQQNYITENLVSMDRGRVNIPTHSPQQNTLQAAPSYSGQNTLPGGSPATPPTIQPYVRGLSNAQLSGLLNSLEPRFGVR